MSINDILNDERIIPTFIDGISKIMTVVCVVVIALLPLIIIAFIKAKNKEREIFGEDEIGPIQVDKNVKIIGVRTDPHPLNINARVYCVVFEFSNGIRTEMAVKDVKTFNKLFQGDIGTLTHQGNRFISFERYIYSH